MGEYSTQISDRELIRQAINNRIFGAILNTSLSSSQIHDITGIGKKIISDRMSVYKKKGIVNVEDGFVKGKKCKIYSCSVIPQRKKHVGKNRNGVIVLTDRYELKPTRDLFELCHKSAILWNCCNNIIKKRYFSSKIGSKESNLDFMMYKAEELLEMVKFEPEFKLLNYQVAVFIIKDLVKHWFIFLKSRAEYVINPKKYTGKPGFPKNKDFLEGQFKIRISGYHVTIRETIKRNNKFLLKYDNGIWYTQPTKYGFLHFPVKNFNITPRKIIYRAINNVLIIPKKGYYLLQVTYDKPIVDSNLDKHRMIGLDLGVNWIGMANNIGLHSKLIKMGYLKSVNNHYNRHISKLRGIYDSNNWRKVTRHKVLGSLLKLRFNTQSHKIQESDFQNFFKSLKTKLKKRQYNLEILRTYSPSELYKLLNNFFPKPKSLVNNLKKITKTILSEEYLKTEVKKEIYNHINSLYNQKTSQTKFRKVFAKIRKISNFIVSPKRIHVHMQKNEEKLICKYQYMLNYSDNIRYMEYSELIRERAILKRETYKYTRKMGFLTRRRSNKIRHQFHAITNLILEYCITNNIGTIVIGYNEKWKQNVRLGKKNNQNFVEIPFLKFINMLDYKGKLIGIDVVKQNESHTSKCSALDFEEICHHDAYLCEKKDGKGRVTRGLFISKKGYKIHSDINGALNIMRKCRPDCLDRFRWNQGVEKWKHFVGVVLRPLVIDLSPDGNRIQ